MTRGFVACWGPAFAAGFLGFLVASPARAALVNVALGQPASQSSNYSSTSYLAPLGVDGNLTNFTHTAGSDTNPSWQVDLQTPYRLEHITLHNRDNCCQLRLRDITVELLDGSGSTVFTTPLLNPGNVLSGPETITVDLSALVGGPVDAQVVRVRRTPTTEYANNNDNRVLSLGEVQVFTDFITTGGTVPGGFVKAGSSSEALYHLDAAQGVTTSGADVASWADQSGRGNDFAQATASKQPDLVAGALGGNALPAIRFDGGNSDPDGPGAGDPAGANADELLLGSSTAPRTVFLVNSTALHRDLDGIWGFENGDKGVRRSSSSAWRGPGSADANDFTQSDGVMRINGEATTNVGLDTPHILAATKGATHTGTYNATSLGQYFQHATHGSRAWAGDIGEVLVFDRELNLAEITVVENHLSAKFDIPLVAGDYYAGDAPGNGDYDWDVFGAGRVDAGNVLREAGAAGMGIQLHEASLADGEFLLAGHKTETNAWVDADLPGFALQRWERVWFLDQTGEVEPMLAFGFSDGGVTTPTLGPGEEYVLLYSPTNDFDFSILSWGGDLYGPQVRFDVAASLLQDGYYTLATARVPEPATCGLLASGVLLLLPIVRRRRARG